MASDVIGVLSAAFLKKSRESCHVNWRVSQVIDFARRKKKLHISNVHFYMRLSYFRMHMDSHVNYKETKHDTRYPKIFAFSHVNYPHSFTCY